jgi:rhomboid-related protein 1/2/3
VYLQNWADMQFAAWNLLIFVILAVVDVGTAVYTRYVLHEDSKVMYM